MGKNKTFDFFSASLFLFNCGVVSTIRPSGKGRRFCMVGLALDLPVEGRRARYLGVYLQDLRLILHASQRPGTSEEVGAVRGKILGMYYYL